MLQAMYNTRLGEYVLCNYCLEKTMIYRKNINLHKVIEENSTFFKFIFGIVSL